MTHSSAELLRVNDLFGKEIMPPKTALNAVKTLGHFGLLLAS